MRNKSYKSMMVISMIIIPILLSCASTQQKQSEPRDAQFYFNRGTAYVAKGEYDRAISEFNKALEINPRYTEAYNLRGGVYSRKGQNDEAISDYSKAIEIDPRDVRAYNYRAWEYTLKGEYDQAISDLKKALEINPRYADTYNNLAWVLATAKVSAFHDGKKALELALKACELSDWKNPGYLDTLAAAYARAGDFENAVKWQERVIESPEVAKQADLQAELQERLKFYKEHKPWPPN